MKLLLLLAPAAAAAFLSYLLAPLAARLSTRVGAVDPPGPRKIHTAPVPCLGGLAVIGAVAVVALVSVWLTPTERWPLTGGISLGLALGVLPIVAVSLWDDIAALSPGPKVLAHLAGAVIAVVCGVSLNPEVHLFGWSIAIGWLAVPLSVLWIVGVTNAFNLVDGLDGLSAGLALIAAISLAGVFLMARQTEMATATLVLAGALAGFLPFNTHPARLFLGDTGATFVGFCLAIFALEGGSTLSAGFATLVPVFLIGLPVAETLVSMARRLLAPLAGKPAQGVFRADRDHIHHRLLKLGLAHSRAVYVLYGAGLLLAGAALLSLSLDTHDAALVLVALLLAGALGLRRLGYDEFAFIRNGLALRAYDVPALHKSLFIAVVDVVLVGVGVYLAIVLKTEDWNLATHRSVALAMFAALAPLTVLVFWRMGLYRGAWRVAAVEDFGRVCGGVVLVSLAGVGPVFVLVPGPPWVPFFAIYALIGLVLAVGVRASYQLIEAAQGSATHAGMPALIYGAGRQGVVALRELMADRSAPFLPVGFLDDDPTKDGQLISGLPVIRPTDALVARARQVGARAVVVATEVRPDHLAAVSRLCETLGIALVRMQVSFDPYDLGASPAARGTVAEPVLSGWSVQRRP